MRVRVRIAMCMDVYVQNWILYDYLLKLDYYIRINNNFRKFFNFWYFSIQFREYTLRSWHSCF